MDRSEKRGKTRQDKTRRSVGRWWWWWWWWFKFSFDRRGGQQPRHERCEMQLADAFKEIACFGALGTPSRGILGLGPETEGGGEVLFGAIGCLVLCKLGWVPTGEVSEGAIGLGRGRGHSSPAAPSPRPFAVRSTILGLLGLACLMGPGLDSLGQAGGKKLVA